MFAGNGMLLPASMTATPEAFNKGQLDGPGPSAGPFVVSALDRTAQRIVLTRNPRWWGHGHAWTASHTWCSMMPPGCRRCRTTQSTPPASAHWTS